MKLILLIIVMHMPGIFQREVHMYGWGCLQIQRVYIGRMGAILKQLLLIRKRQRFLIRMIIIQLLCLLRLIISYLNGGILACSNIQRVIARISVQKHFGILNFR
ncbi:hypothetical protein DXB60_16995 [Bacteroides fragilis]|nr:hypothetical protein DXB60_16995 [Bacteroides fragilis]